MGAFPTLAETFHELAQLGRDLDAAVKHLNDLDQQRITAEANYKVAYARVYREGAGSIEDRKQQAVIACDALWRHFQTTESAVKLQQQHLRALQSRIEIHRSTFSALKAEMAFVNTGGPS